jgi:hypothetical protein
MQKTLKATIVLMITLFFKLQRKLNVSQEIQIVSIK